MRRFAGIAGVLALLAGAFAVGLLATRVGERSPPPSTRDEPLRVIDQVRGELAASYYRDVPRRILSRGSVESIVDGLRDPFTDYLTPREYAELQDDTAKSYSGVGLTVRPSRNGLIVKAALQGPARAAGIRAGDRIVSINGRRVRRLPFDRSLQLIKGRAGTKVRLTVRRPREGTLSVVVERVEIELPAVTGRLLARPRGRLGTVRVISFRANAADAIEARAAALLKRGAKGLVLDLRDNPGGLLSQAVGTVSLFVEAGVVCITEGAKRGRQAFDVSGRAPLAKVPLVVLVDSGSASAAEIVAAALDAHGRATVVGERTYGKTSVQSVRELSNGAALKLTTAVFLTPTGENLTARGLAPDVRAVDRPATRRDEALTRASRILLRQIARS
jgi:carboxyl-terminal processing protease